MICFSDDNDSSVSVTSLSDIEDVKVDSHSPRRPLQRDNVAWISLHEDHCDKQVPDTSSLKRDKLVITSEEKPGSASLGIQKDFDVKVNKKTPFDHHSKANLNDKRPSGTFDRYARKRAQALNVKAPQQKDKCGIRTFDWTQSKVDICHRKAKKKRIKHVQYNRLHPRGIENQYSGPAMMYNHEVVQNINGYSDFDRHGHSVVSTRQGSVIYRHSWHRADAKKYTGYRGGGNNFFNKCLPLEDPNLASNHHSLAYEESNAGSQVHAEMSWDYYGTPYHGTYPGGRKQHNRPRGEMLMPQPSDIKDKHQSRGYFRKEQSAEKDVKVPYLDENFNYDMNITEDDPQNKPPPLPPKTYNKPKIAIYEESEKIQRPLTWHGGLVIGQNGAKGHGNDNLIGNVNGQNIWSHSVETEQGNNYFQRSREANRSYVRQPPKDWFENSRRSDRFSDSYYHMKNSSEANSVPERSTLSPRQRFEQTRHKFQNSKPDNSTQIDQIDINEEQYPFGENRRSQSLPGSKNRNSFHGEDSRRSHRSSTGSSSLDRSRSADSGKRPRLSFDPTIRPPVDSSRSPAEISRPPSRRIRPPAERSSSEAKEFHIKTADGGQVFAVHQNILRSGKDNSGSPIKIKNRQSCPELHYQGWISTGSKGEETDQEELNRYIKDIQKQSSKFYESVSVRRKISAPQPPTALMMMQSSLSNSVNGHSKSVSGKMSQMSPEDVGQIVIQNSAQESEQNVGDGDKRLMPDQIYPALDVSREHAEIHKAVVKPLTKLEEHTENPSNLDHVVKRVVDNVANPLDSSGAGEIHAEDKTKGNSEMGVTASKVDLSRDRSSGSEDTVSSVTKPRRLKSILKKKGESFIVMPLCNQL